MAAVPAVSMCCCLVSDVEPPRTPAELKMCQVKLSVVKYYSFSHELLYVM